MTLDVELRTFLQQFHKVAEAASQLNNSGEGPYLVDALKDHLGIVPAQVAATGGTSHAACCSTARQAPERPTPSATSSAPRRSTP